MFASKLFGAAISIQNGCGSSVNSGMGYTFSALVYWYKKVNMAKLGKQYLRKQKIPYQEITQ